LRTLAAEACALALHREIARDEAAHRMSDDVKTQAGLVRPPFYLPDLSGQFARRFDVVPPPVVSEQVIGVVIAVGRGRVNVAAAVTAVVFERLEQRPVCADFGNEFDEL